MSKKTVAIDFDGVIHKYTSPWTSAEEIHDGVVLGAGKFIQNLLLSDYEVVILSTRAKTPEGCLAINKWLKENLVGELTKEEVDSIVPQIKITANKIPAIIYIDDRGWQFNGVFPDMGYINNFTPWNRR